MKELKELHHKQQNSNKVQFSKIERNKCAESCKTFLGGCLNITCAGANKITQGEIGLLMRFGKFVKKLPPGQYVINPCTEAILIQSTKTKVKKFNILKLIK